jgi:hypothetical protein
MAHRRRPQGSPCDGDPDSVTGKILAAAWWEHAGGRYGLMSQKRPHIIRVGLAAESSIGFESRPPIMYRSAMPGGSLDRQTPKAPDFSIAGLPGFLILYCENPFFVDYRSMIVCVTVTSDFDVSVSQNVTVTSP